MRKLFVACFAMAAIGLPVLVEGKEKYSIDRRMDSLRKEAAALIRESKSYQEAVQGYSNRIKVNRDKLLNLQGRIDELTYLKEIQKAEKLEEAEKAKKAKKAKKIKKTKKAKKKKEPKKIKEDH